MTATTYILLNMPKPKESNESVWFKSWNSLSLFWPCRLRG